MVTAAAIILFARGPATAEEIEDYVREQMNKQHIPGLTFAVTREGKLDRAEGYGMANLELQVPARPETVFQIQSITKTFTATAIMLLSEQGKLSVDDKITKHLSDLPGCWSEITIRHLLSHTSGIKDFINEPTIDLKQDIKAEDVIASLKDRALNFAPGEKYAYSNTGYHLLGMIIHKLTGQLWGDFVKERIFDPLEMNQTRVVSLSEVITNRAAGYVWEENRIKNGHYLAPSVLAYAGGGLRSTALDLARWDAALWSDKILQQSTLQQMWTSAKCNDGSNAGYGFGWGVGEMQGHRFVSHTGSHMTGFKTIIMRFLEDKLSVIVLTNQRNADQTAIAKGIAGFYFKGIKAKVAGN